MQKNKLIVLAMLTMIIVMVMASSVSFATESGQVNNSVKPNTQTGDTGLSDWDFGKLASLLVSLVRILTALTGVFFVLMIIIRGWQGMSALDPRKKAAAWEAVYDDLKWAAIAFGATFLASMIQSLVKMLQ